MPSAIPAPKAPPFCTRPLPFFFFFFYKIFFLYIFFFFFSRCYNPIQVQRQLINFFQYLFLFYFYNCNLVNRRKISGSTFLFFFLGCFSSYSSFKLVGKPTPSFNKICFCVGFFFLHVILHNNLKKIDSHDFHH